MKRSRVGLLALAIGLMALVVASLGEPPQVQAQEVELDKVDAATKKGANFLKQASWLFMDIGSAQGGNEKEQQDVGVACLAGMALLECDVPKGDGSIQRAMKICKEAAPRLSKTYPLSLAIMFLSRYGNASDNALIKTLCIRLMAGQAASGAWSYDCLVRNADQEREWTTWFRDREKLTKVDPNDLQGGFTPPGTVSPDNSNTQFAVLALFLGRKSGVPVKYALLRVEQRFRSTQGGDGGWGYGMTANDRSKAGMTCAGLLALAIGAGNAQERQAVLRAGGGVGAGGGAGAAAPANPGLSLDELQKDPAVLRARSYIEGEIRMGSIEHFLYFLWSLERVCVVYEWDDKNWWDWYSWAGNSLLKSQRQDGSWSYEYGTSVDTAFALLVLKKANLLRDLVKKSTFRSGSADSGKAAPIGGPGKSGTPPPAEAQKPKDDLPDDAKLLAKELITSTGARRLSIIEKLKTGKSADFTAALADSIPQLAGSDQEAARRGLAERLGRFGPKTIVPYLSSTERELKLAAAVASGTKSKDMFKDYVPGLIPLLDDFDDAVKGAAYDSLKALSGEDFGRSPSAWKTWLSKQP